MNREIYNLKWNAKQRWYWIRDQTPDEVTLFVNWDSAPIDGGAECESFAAAKATTLSQYLNSFASLCSCCIP